MKAQFLLAFAFSVLSSHAGASDFTVSQPQFFPEGQEAAVGNVELETGSFKSSHFSSQNTFRVDVSLEARAGGYLNGDNGVPAKDLGQILLHKSSPITMEPGRHLSYANFNDGKGIYFSTKDLNEAAAKLGRPVGGVGDYSLVIEVVSIGTFGKETVVNSISKPIYNSLGNYDSSGDSDNKVYLLGHKSSDQSGTSLSGWAVTNYVPNLPGSNPDMLYKGVPNSKIFHTQVSHGSEASQAAAEPADETAHVATPPVGSAQ